VEGENYLVKLMSQWRMHGTLCITYHIMGGCMAPNAEGSALWENMWCLMHEVPHYGQPYAQGYD
jgi:hypothetical protein